MLSKLTEHGNNLALVLDRDLLDLLHITSDTELELTTDGGHLIITPLNRSETRREKFEAAQDWAHNQYGEAFRKLAE